MSIARRVTLTWSFALFAAFAANAGTADDEPRTPAEPVAESTPAPSDRTENATAGETAAEPVPPVPAAPPVMPATVVTPSGVQGENATTPSAPSPTTTGTAGKGKPIAAAGAKTTTPAAAANAPRPPADSTHEQPRAVSLGRYGAIELGRPPQTQSRWKGFPISLSLRDAPLPEVLRSFARIAGVNLVLHPGVTGTVTVELHDVPWDQALYVILKTQGMAAEIDGRVWIVEPN